jgi:dephospho-CoA kinase
MAYVIGITGGIGCGKSAVAEAFARRGVTVVDTDAIAHGLTGPGGGAIGPIRHAFGEPYITPQGALDRARMRQRAFTDPAARQALESILHPLIRAESDRQIAMARGPYALLVIPLLVETGVDRRRYDRILVVDCDEATQLARVMKRGLAEDEVRRIMAAQAARSERLAHADDVLENNGTMAELDLKVDALHRRYAAYACGEDPDAPGGPGQGPVA